MTNKEPGYVYRLANPCFREDWGKIGKIFFASNSTDNQEDDILTSQIVIIKSGRSQNIKFMSYAFTEQKVAFV